VIVKEEHELAAFVLGVNGAALADFGEIVLRGADNPFCDGWSGLNDGESTLRCALGQCQLLASTSCAD
jgi:hypothetical protein